MFVKFYRPQQKHTIDIENLPSFVKRRNKVTVDTASETVLNKFANKKVQEHQVESIAGIFGLIENYF